MLMTHKFFLFGITGAVSALLPTGFAPVDAVTLEIAFYGGLGGLTNWVGLKRPWCDGLRVVVLGILLAVGLGVLGPVITEQYFGETPEHLVHDPRTRWAAAYFVGMTATALLNGLLRWVAAKAGGTEEK